MNTWLASLYSWNLYTYFPYKTLVRDTIPINKDGRREIYLNKGKLQKLK